MTLVVFIALDRPDIAVIAFALLSIIAIISTYRRMNFNGPECNQPFIAQNEIIGSWPPLESFQHTCKECGLSDKALN